MSEVLPKIEEANMISDKLDRLTKFEMVVVPPDAVGLDGSQSQVYVRVRNFANGLTYDWTQEKFLDRFILIQEMYENFAAGEEWRVSDEKDPFTEPIDLRARIGIVPVYLKSVAYFIQAKAQFEITDVRGNEVGILSVEVLPCDAKGVPLTEDEFVENPNTLIGEDLHFIFKINNARGIPPRFTDIRGRYRVFLDQNFVETQIISDNSNPDFFHEKLFSFKPVTHDVLKYLLEGRILVELWGLQVPIKRNVVGDTHVVMQVESLSGETGFRIMDVDKHRLQMEVEVLRKKGAITDEKMTYLRKMLDHADKKGTTSLPTNQIQGILDATTNEEIQRWAHLEGVKSAPPGRAKVKSAKQANGHVPENKQSPSCTLC